MSNEVENIFNRLENNDDVLGVICVNNEGEKIRSTLKDEETKLYYNQVSQVAEKARSVVRDLDPTNDLNFLRIKSRKNEMMIARHKDFLLIVVQKPYEK